MNKEKVLGLLRPFIQGKVPKDKRWYDATRQVASQIPTSEVEETVGILKEMFHNPLDPSSSPEREIPGAHGVYSNLFIRRLRRARSPENKG